MRVYLDIDRLLEVLAYEADTGHFVWRKPRPFCSIGKRAGTLTSPGYVVIAVEGRKYMAHRLAWLYTHRRWPTEEIDHINGVRSDNRLVNLREATPSQNQANKAMRRDNTSGAKGVTWDKSRSDWIAAIHVNGSRKYLGRFSSVEEASAAYAVAASHHFGEFARPERNF
jgi:hypothetical protein